MTDRELLELAAKAAGIKINKSRQAERDSWDEEGLGELALRLGLWTTTTTNWNPLIDDGDAFRLASATNQTVEFGNNMVIHPSMEAGEGIDPLNATRRAIVRVAAEIGRVML